MAPVRRWTGVEAKALRQAMRLSVREFAEYTGDLTGRVVTTLVRNSAGKPPIELDKMVQRMHLHGSI